MADQTNKSTQGNVSGEIGTGQGSGASTRQARETRSGAAAGSESKAMNTGMPNPGTGQPATGTTQASGTTGSADALDAAKDTAKNLVDQAKSTAGTAYEAVADKATTKLEEQKATVADGLTSVAESVRSMSSNLNNSPENNPLAGYTAQYADTAARKLEQVAHYFEGTNIRGMARDIEGFARRNPAVFLGGAFALGLLAARFIKSSPTRFDSRFQTGIDHQLPAADTANRPDIGIGTTRPGVM